MITAPAGPAAHRNRWGPAAGAGGLFVAAVVVGTFLARPFHAANVGFDSQASVLYFDRIVSGHQLEAFVSTTPKPLQTLIYGLLMATTHDWRSLSVATIAAFGLAVAATAELSRRTAGPIAWLAVGLALIGSLALDFDAAFALATPWALLCVAAAGLALTGRRPRHATAGLLLAAAALFRLEALLVVAVAAACLAARQVLPARLAGARPEGREWLILLGFLALPMMVLHDALLAGDPWYWLMVAPRYTAISGLPVPTVLSMAHVIADQLRAEWLVTLLAALGAVRLLVDRRWVVLAGVAAFGPGMAAFLLLLAFRGIYVPDRYLAPIELALIVAAGPAVAWLVGLVPPSADRLRGSAWLRPGLGLAAAVAFAAVGVWRSGLLSADLHAAARNGLAVAIDTSRVEPALSSFVDATPGARSWTPGAAAEPLLHVPIAVRPRLSVDLGLPLTRIVDLRSQPVTAADIGALRGRWVFHDRRVDGSIPLLEVEAPRPIGEVTIVPIVVDPDRGYWLLAIEGP